jgi:para-nitrobenzyl esterase
MTGPCNRAARRLSRRTLLRGSSHAATWAALGGIAPGVFSPPARARFLPNPQAVVETRHGTVRGGTADGVHIFRGVPYGAPTGGEHRFMPPRAPAPWSGVMDTLEYGDACPQESYNLERPSGISWFTPFWTAGSSEDCLRLNVWTPALESGKRPVLVWLHGGGFAQGSGASSSYDGSNQVRAGDVVTVTLNHRLNAFGYTHLAELGGDGYANAGNVGMLDIVAALGWVRDNIAGFGGDPSNVMIYGESGGGAKVSVLLGMPAARGLFHRAVIQSGPALQVEDPDNATRAARHLFDELGIAAGNVRALQQVPAGTLVKAQAAASARSAREDLRAFRPVLGEVIPEHPFDPVASELSRNVPLIIGTNQHEITLFVTQDRALYHLDEAGLEQRTRALVGERTGEVLDTYRRMMPGASPSDRYFTLASDQRTRLYSIYLAERKARQGAAPAFMYRFDWLTPAWEGRFRAAHAFEIPFVFGNAQLNDDITGGGPDAVALAANMRDAWIAFARHGNPAHAGLPAWPPYDEGRRATMIFNDRCEVVDDPGSAARQLWQRLEA